MALGAHLNLHTSQSMAMTPRLQQSIKLLQLSAAQLAQFVDGELEKNPLLERDETQTGEEHDPDRAGEEPAHGDAENREDTWDRPDPAVGAAGGDAERMMVEPPPLDFRQPMSAPTSGGSGAGASDIADWEAYVAQPRSMRDHLGEQAALTFFEPADRAVAGEIIDALDADGFLRDDTGAIARRLGVAHDRLLSVLARVQEFDPTGIAARSLAECLSLQLAERDRLDPAMRELIANLDLLATRRFDKLSQICGVDDRDIADMVDEIRALDPRPGRRYEAQPVQPIVPDVTVRARPDSTWSVELNPHALPRVLVNRQYHARIAPMAHSEDDRRFITESLQSANWLVHSLDQRARTILKVASEIVRQQDGFFAYGIEHLKPLNLSTVAEAIGMHESTISRATANKYLACERGIFELRFFFTAAIAGTDGQTSHSATSVRHRIADLIEAEDVHNVLSDDAIVTRLRDEGIHIARRTVAKYREAMGLAASPERRREKRLRAAS